MSAPDASLRRSWITARPPGRKTRSTLYKTIERLRDAGLIAVNKTERDHRFPERTLYALTEEGMRVSREWLTEMLATARNEFPEFPAATRDDGHASRNRLKHSSRILLLRAAEEFRHAVGERFDIRAVVERLAGESG